MWRLGKMVSKELPSNVARVLQLASERAERHILLENARVVIERHLNIPVEPEMLPWGSALLKLICIQYSSYELIHPLRMCFHIVLLQLSHIVMLSDRYGGIWT